MAERKKTIREAVTEPAAATEPALTPEALSGFRVAFARDVMMSGIQAALSRANFVGLDLEAQASFAVKAADALVKELTAHRTVLIPHGEPS